MVLLMTSRVLMVVSTLASGFKRNQIGNDNIKWETTTQTDLGFDFAFFRNTLYGNFDWYFKKTKDILVNMPGIAVMGEGSSQWINAGEMENRGFEFNIGYRNQTHFGLKYDITANISSYRNKITALPTTVAANGTFGGNGVKSVIGHPMGATGGICSRWYLQEPGGNRQPCHTGRCRLGTYPLEGLNWRP